MRLPRPLAARSWARTCADCCCHAPRTSWRCSQTRWFLVYGLWSRAFSPRASLVRSRDALSPRCSSSFWEWNVLALLINLLALFFIGQRLERVWGAGVCTALPLQTRTHAPPSLTHTPHVQEFLRFILLVSLSVGTGTFVVMYFLYVLTRDQFYLFARFGGFHGVVAGLLVALRQMAGDEAPLDWMAASLYVRGLRNKHLAPLYVVGTLLLALLNGARHHHVGLYLFVLFGAYSAWLYLRFWQDVSAASGGGCGGGASSGQPRLRGDPRPEFSFAACFPEPCHPLITRLLAAPCHRCCCAGEPSYAGGAAWLDAVHAAERGQGRQREQQERGRRLLDQRLLHPPSTGALSTGAAVELATPAQVGEEEREPVAEGVKDSAV